jgi:hypothetical protein
MTEKNELHIDKTNFAKYFRPVNQSKPEKGDCIALFTAVAELVDGFEKKQMIELLKQECTAKAVATMMKKLCYAKEPDNYRIPQVMANDLLLGMTDEQIMAKPYEYIIELFYYTKPQHVPENDPNWKIVDIVNLEDYFKFEVKSDVHSKDSASSIPTDTDNTGVIWESQ